MVGDRVIKILLRGIHGFLRRVPPHAWVPPWNPSERNEDTARFLALLLRTHRLDLTFVYCKDDYAWWEFSRESIVKWWFR